MRIFKPLSILMLLAGCGVAPVDIDITHRTPIARIRLLDLSSGEGPRDLVSQVPDERPDVIRADLAPSASSFTEVAAGQARLYVTSQGVTLAQTEVPLAEGADYNAIVTGAPGAFHLSLVGESTAVIADMSIVRIVNGSPVEDLSITIAGYAVPVASGLFTAWVVFDPADSAVVSIQSPSLGAFTFNGLPLPVGGSSTMAIVGNPPDVPLQIFLIPERGFEEATPRLIAADVPPPP